MNLRMDAARHLLGRTISDPYGATIGKIVGISTDVKSEVTSIEVELGSGQFLNCPPSQIIVDDKGVKLLDEWKLESDNLSTELNLAMKRMNALSELHRQGDIQPDIYQDFRRNHDTNLKELETRKEALVKKLALVTNRFDQQIKELELFLVINKMQLASGEIDPQAYKVAVDSIENGLNRAFLAKRDIESILTQISALKISRLEDQKNITTTKGEDLREKRSITNTLLPLKHYDASNP